MRATFLKEIPTSRDMLSTFGGYDGRERIAEGSFGDMLNLSSRHYPVMSTRRARAWLKDIEGLQGILAKDTLIWVANNKLYVEGEEIPDVNFTDGEKQIVSMGGYVVIYPDQIRYNMATGESERLSRETYSDSLLSDFKTSLYMRYESYTGERYDKLPDGTPYNSAYIPQEGDIAYYRWNGDSEKKVYYTYTDGKFIPMTISELSVFFNSKTEYRRLPWIEEINKLGDIRFFCNCYREYVFKYKRTSKIGQFEWLATGDIEPSITYEDLFGKFQSIIVTESGIELIKLSELNANIPDIKLDGVFENGNRLWGYRYGENVYGEFVNEVYSTALGDPIGWDIFEGIASDSYAAAIGSDGPFTGASSYSGSLYFFKENYMHRLMGNKPSNYQISTLSCHGVEAGSERSLVCLGDALYYKGNDGIYCYDGSIPYRISDVFGEKRYKNAVGGVLGSLVFMDMENEKGKRVMFVYDTSKRLWHIEESAAPNEFIPAFGNLIYRTERGLGAILGDELDGELIELFGEDIRREGIFKWFGEFGDFGLSSPDAKYVSKLQLRMTVDEGAKVSVEVMTDSDGSWETVDVISAQNKRSVCLPIVTPRCDHFRLRLSGEGGFKLWSLTKETESTNEVR